MKKDNNNLDLNNFHLQLYALEQQQKTVNIPLSSMQEPFVYRIEYFPTSISMTSSILYFALYLLWFINMLDSYLLTYSIIYNQGQVPFMHTITSFIFRAPTLGYIIHLFFIICIAISLVFHNQEANEGLFYFVWYLGNTIYPYLRYIIQGFFFSSSYFAGSGDILSILLFVIACIFSFLYTLLLQNITLRKDQFCCKSLQFSMLLKICITVSQAINIILVMQAYTSAQLLGCIIGHLIISLVLIICYFNFGLIIYRHKVARYACFLIIVTYFSLTFSFLIDIISTQIYSYGSSNVYVIFIVNFTVLLFFFISSLQRIKHQSNSPEYKNLKNKIYFSFNKYEQADEDEQIDCQIRGILHQHFTKGCKNVECIANIKQLYDSKKKKKCSITKIGQGKVSIIKFYVKCLYQMAIKEDEHNIHLKIDFIQFYYLKLKNIYCSLRKIAQLELHYLSFYQKLRLTRIKEYLIKQSNQFSSEIYSKSLATCKVINSEEIFLKIQKLIAILLARNELFWKYLSFNEVELKEIIKIVEPNFKLMDIISEQWNKVSNFFSINRRWKFYYICFTLFIKNQKIKPSMIQDFGNSVEYDSIFKTDNYFVDKTTEKQLLFNPIMLFQQNTCYVHTKCDEEKMVITKISNFFPRNFDFAGGDIIGSSINVLMPPSIRKFHHEMFFNWIKTGKSSNETLYQVKKIYPITKRGYLYPCFKFYKRYIQINGDTEYITMFKSNKQDEQLILVNNNFQIEGITISLHHKLKLNSGDYAYLKGISILSLMPLLIKYTKFANQIEERDEDFLENDDNQNYFKKQASNLKSIIQDTANANILHDRKVLNLSNMKLYVPSDFQSTLDHYTYLLSKKTQQFDAIRQLYHFIRKDKKLSKFKTQICIRERNVYQTRYYEIQINEIQQNNRLQKLKMSQIQQQLGKQQQTNRQIDQHRLNQMDMQLFFSMSKKKNKVVLFPSKNIFLKDENNRALTEISHINNINIFIRISLILFLTLVLSLTIIELNLVSTFNNLTNQYYQISRYQKTTFMLNTQYNIQHIQPGNYYQQSFYIIAYTHQLLLNYNSTYFQRLIFDSSLNNDGQYHPYQLVMPSNTTKNMVQPTYDQYNIFFKIFQCAINLHRMAEKEPQNRLDVAQYYEFNNYVYAFHGKAEEIKANIISKFEDNYIYLRRVDLIFGIVIATVVVGSLLFSISRLLKVSNGFQELVSILIQIDNSDMRNIIKYVAYTKYLFEHLNEKHERMETQNQTQYSSTSNNFKSFQKKSSDMTEEELRMAGSSANLNKKIKKIDIGQEITKMIIKPAAILLITIALIGGILLVLNIYSIITLDSYHSYQQVGFNFMKNNGINNIIVNGAIEKYRGGLLYDYQKYQKYINKSLQNQATNKDITFTTGSSKLQQALKTLYFDNFCQKLSFIFNKTLTYEYETICGQTNAIWCSSIQASLSESGMINRCSSIQKGQMIKGVYNYDNFLLQEVAPLYSGLSNMTLENIVEINDAYKIIDAMMFYFMDAWNTESCSIVAERQGNIVIIVICVFISTILLNIVFIQYFVKNTLNQRYETFRLIHEHYIPEWIIVKEKIIKVKLIKEGFMKE